MKRDEEAEERARLDERWDRLSTGELSPEEEAELRALAEASEEARQAYDAFRPLGPDFHARVVNAVRAEQKPARPEQPPARVLPFRRARLAGWLTAAAAAAAVLLVLLRPPAPLPDYDPPEVSGGPKAMRGETQPEEVPVFAPGDSIHVVVRPETTVSKVGKLEARCVLVRGGDAHLLDVRSESDPGGSVQMDGALSPDLAPGDWTLWAVVGRPGELPDPAELRTLPASEVRRDDWTAVPAAIRIRASPR